MGIALGVVWVGWAAAPALALLCSPAASLNISRRIPVLDVARADVSPSLLVLRACKLSDPIPPSVAVAAP